MKSDKIIDEVKDYLQISEDLSELELLKRLRNEMSMYHPDRAPQNSEQYKFYSEKFKKLNSLAQKLKKYVSEHEPGTELMKVSEADSLKSELAIVFDQLNALENADRLQSHIKLLNSQNENLTAENTQLKQQVELLKSQLEERNNIITEQKREELINLYSLPLKRQIGGLVSLVCFITTLLPRISSLMTEHLGIVGSGLQIFLGVVAFCYVYSYFYKKIQRYFILDTIEYLTKPSNLALQVNAEKKLTDGYRTAYFVSQKDLQSYADLILGRNGVRFFFVFDKNKASNLVTRNVIAHYLLFDLFKDKKSDGFDTLFKVEFTKDADKSKIDDGTIPF